MTNAQFSQSSDSDITDAKQDGGPLIVGIGASAGGLEAFQGFVQGLPDDHQMAIVLVQHLDPDHESLMPELVTKRTKSQVHSVEDGMQVEAGHIYLMPPAFEMDVKEGCLRLVEFSSPRGLRRPINRFSAALPKMPAKTQLRLFFRARARMARKVPKPFPRPAVLCWPKSWARRNTTECRDLS